MCYPPWGTISRKDRSTMKQNEKMKQPPAKSRYWLEAECLRLASGAPGGGEIQRVTIRRLHPKGTGPNWKVADLIPQPSLRVSSKIRDALAPLMGRYIPSQMRELSSPNWPRRPKGGVRN